MPLIWPCDDDSPIQLLDDYWDDQCAADRSDVAFSRMIGKFFDWRYQDQNIQIPCKRKINVLAHSMGNRVLRNALSFWVKNQGQGIMPEIFRNVFMVAADVVDHTMEDGNEGRYICVSGLFSPPTNTDHHHLPS